MFNANMAEYRTKQQEMQRQAENYRLVRSVSTPNPLVSRLADQLGQALIQSGKALIGLVED